MGLVRHLDERGEVRAQLAELDDLVGVELAPGDERIDVALDPASVSLIPASIFARSAGSVAMIWKSSSSLVLYAAIASVRPSITESRD